MSLWKSSHVGISIRYCVEGHYKGFDLSV